MRPFNQILPELSRGATLERLTEALGQVTEAVEKTGQAGSLTLKLNMKSNGDGSVMIEEQISAKVPDADRGKTLFFVTADNDLSRRDPRQPDLPHIHAVENGGVKH